MGRISIFCSSNRTTVLRRYSPIYELAFCIADFSLNSYPYSGLAALNGESELQGFYGQMCVPEVALKSTIPLFGWIIHRGYWTPEISCSTVSHYANETIIRDKQWNMKQELNESFLYNLYVSSREIEVSKLVQEVLASVIFDEFGQVLFLIF